MEYIYAKSKAPKLRITSYIWYNITVVYRHICEQYSIIHLMHAVQTEVDMMKAGSMACYVMAMIFYVIAFIFVIKKEKAAGLISGFNSLPKEEQKNYDTARMVLDMRADVQTWATLFLFGGVITYMVSQWLTIAVFAIWFYLFFKQVKLDAHKAFEKYRL